MEKHLFAVDSRSFHIPSDACSPCTAPPPQRRRRALSQVYRAIGLPSSRAPCTPRLPIHSLLPAPPRGGCNHSSFTLRFHASTASMYAFVFHAVFRATDVPHFLHFTLRTIIFFPKLHEPPVSSTSPPQNGHGFSSAILLALHFSQRLLGFLAGEKYGFSYGTFHARAERVRFNVPPSLYCEVFHAPDSVLEDFSGKHSV